MKGRERPIPRPRPSLRVRVCAEEAVDEVEGEEDAAGADVTVTVAADDVGVEELDAALVDAAAEARS